MGKKKILAIVAILFLCGLSCLATVGAALLFRQNQLNQSEIKTLKDQVEQLKQEKEQGAKGNDSSGIVPPTTTTPPATTPPTDGGDSDIGATMIYFSKTPESFDTDFSFTVAVARGVNAMEPVESAVNEIITGPTAEETALGYRNPIVLTGTSNCGGSNFTTTMNLNSSSGLTDTQVRFCKDLPTGLGSTARIKSVISDTLGGLGTSLGFHLGNLAILDKDGNCYGDESGMNVCLH